MEPSVKGRHVVIVGFGSSGEAAARLCLRKGAHSVVLNDRREAADLNTERVVELARDGVRFDLGAHRHETFAKADLVVLSPGVPPLDAVRDAASRGVPVIGEVELASWFTEAPIIAITGTNGKSTVTTLIGEILKASGFATFIGGNLGTAFSDATELPAARAAGRLVLELSSYQLETIVHLRPSIAVHLNLTPDHLDRYGSMVTYGAAKARIFLNQTRDDHAVAPDDDPLVLSFARAGAAMLHTFGGEHGEVRIEDGVITTRSGRRYPLSILKLRGAHNVSNTMASVLAAELAGATHDATFDVLESFTGLSHRMQFVLADQGVVFYDDSKATNVGAAVKALEGMQRKVVLIAGGRDKGGSYDPLVQLLRTKGRAVVLLGEAAPKIRTALGSTIPHRVVESMDEAVRVARMLVEPGDCVLLAPACSSFDMFESYAHRGRAFVEAVRTHAEEPTDIEPPLPASHGGEP